MQVGIIKGGFNMIIFTLYHKVTIGSHTDWVNLKSETHLLNIIKYIKKIRVDYPNIILSLVKKEENELNIDELLAEDANEKET